MTGLLSHHIGELSKMELDINRLIDEGREDLRRKAHNIKEIDKLGGRVMVVGGLVIIIGGLKGLWLKYRELIPLSDPWVIGGLALGVVNLVLGILMRHKAMCSLEELHKREFPDDPIHGGA